MLTILFLAAAVCGSTSEVYRCAVAVCVTASHVGGNAQPARLAGNLHRKASACFQLGLETQDV